MSTEEPVTPKRSATFGTETSEETEGRDRWPSRTAFYLAAIGSAVGFGNVWRFPALAKDYGGGAFFIPYVMAFFLIGLPVLILEIALGQTQQTGNVGVFGYFHRRFRGVGMASVACAFMLVVYYSILLAWVTNAFFDSFGDSDPWAEDGTTGEEAVEYFQQKIVGMSSIDMDGNLRPTRLVWANVGYALLVWLCVWGSVAFGLLWTGRLTYFTMGLPILLLFIFLGRAVSLEGAEDGIKEYIGQWEMDVLRERPDVWSTAVSQIFFSLSVTFGTMTAYGSHCPRQEPAVLNSIVIGVSNCMFSFISGFAVFASMGHLSYLTGTPVDEVPYSGFDLVFGTWPVTFGTLKGGEHWVRLLFFNLFLLGIDSAFSILEGPITVMQDFLHKRGTPVAKWKVAGGFCFVAYLLSFMYATDAGLFFLDVVDFYINFVLLLVGFFESFGAGWMYGLEDQIASLGPAPVATYMLANFGSVVAACCCWFGIDDSDTAVWAGFVVLGGSYFIGIFATYFLLKSSCAARDKNMSNAIYELSLGNVMKLREELSKSVGWMPWIWAFTMKQMIPHVLLILFINLARSNNAEGEPKFGNYGNYIAWPYQVVGIACVVVAAVLFLVGVATPSAFGGADLSTINNTPEEEVKELEDDHVSETSLGHKHEVHEEPESVEA